MKNYEEALQIKRGLVSENPGTYLPDLADTINNMAILYWDKNEIQQAIEKYEESLKISRELTRENPKKYLPGLAKTLNNLAFIHKDKNELREASEKYDEALQIYRELAKSDPGTSEIIYAEKLIVGVSSFNRQKQDLRESESILKKYVDLPRAIKLLEIIKKMDEQ